MAYSSGKAWIGIRIMAGLAIAAVAIMFAMLTSGAGHGWVSPFPFSFAMLIMWPLVLVRMASEGKGIVLDWVLIADAAMLDLGLAWTTWTMEADYVGWAFRSGMAYPWLAVWGLWQLLAVMSVIRRMNLRTGVI